MHQLKAHEGEAAQRVSQRKHVPCSAEMKTLLKGGWGQRKSGAVMCRLRITVQTKQFLGVS